MIAKFYLPAGELKDGYQLLANDISDLMSSVDQNIRQEVEEQHLHLKTEYDRIPTKHLSTNDAV